MSEEMEVDTQAFLTGEHDVVTQLRTGVVPMLEFAGPEATDFVLSHLENVTYRDDVAAYLAEAQTVITAALTLALQPRFDQLRLVVGNEELKRQEEERARFEREFEAFKQMRTPPAVN